MLARQIDARTGRDRLVPDHLLDRSRSDRARPYPFGDAPQAAGALIEAVDHRLDHNHRFLRDGEGVVDEGIAFPDGRHSRLDHHGVTFNEAVGRVLPGSLVASSVALFPIDADQAQPWRANRAHLLPRHRDLSRVHHRERDEPFPCSSSRRFDGGLRSQCRKVTRVLLPIQPERRCRYGEGASAHETSKNIGAICHLHNSIGPRSSDVRLQSGTVERRSREPAPIYLSPVCAWRQRGVVRGFWIGLPLSLTLWYALARASLALAGGL